MKKSLKKFLIVICIIIGVLVLFIAIDTIQAIIFNNSPWLHKREYTCRYSTTYYIDKGIFVNHFHCGNVDETLFNGTKSDCIVCYDK